MKLLAIDTATEHCSVALWRDGVIASRSATGTRTASAQVLDLVAACLLEGGLALGELDAIAFGCGPGGFTGVRLAASVTQGLAFASGRPVLPVSNLRAVAQRALSLRVADQQAMALAPAVAHVLVCQDARMGEVYWATFAVRGGFAELTGIEAVNKPERVVLPEGWQPSEVIGAGSGFEVFPTLSLMARPVIGCHSRADEIAQLAAHAGLDAALPPEQALPVYVRNNVAVPSL